MKAIQDKMGMVVLHGLELEVVHTLQELRVTTGNCKIVQEAGLFQLLYRRVINI